MSEKTDVWQGTLALMALKTLEALGPLHGYGIARRIEQTSGNKFAINSGTIYHVWSSVSKTGAPRPAPGRRRQPCVPTPAPRPDQRLPAPKTHLCAPWSPDTARR